ncbi:MAG: outer membrane beta-barrel protein [bacterium]|nr:outer membrane beta-barrel protein [bacterium]
MKRYIIAGAVAISLAILSGEAQAETNIGFRGLGANVALVDIQAGSTIGFGGMVDLGYISENIRLEANIDLWSKSWDAGYDYYYEESLKWSLSDVAIGGTAKYELGEVGAPARWYVGAGLGMHFLSSEISGGGESDSVSDSRIGIDLLGGVNINSEARTSYFAELRYRTVWDWTQTCVRAGVKFALGS